MSRLAGPASETGWKFRLEDHLVLAKFIASKLGINDLSDISKFSDVKEGFDLDGRSYMYHHLTARQGLDIPEGKLRQYDDNIREHFERIRKRREETISLKYYQYLSLLFSEIYLDSFFRNPVLLQNELNKWLEKNGEVEHVFSRSDMKKIAYWMATGSGKTLIMHANLWQFMTYNKGPKKLDYENIVLITTSDEMSEQHLKELQKSGISATLFQGEFGGYFETDKNTVKVISIHKLKLPEDKKGEGVTLDVSSLGTKNLVLVDEGHKGQRTEERKWKRARNFLAENGFTFEYSATFGQAITSSNEESFREYSKAILFDYSYKYFWADGYGKDFRILNLDSKVFADGQIPVLLLANTLSFCEQILVYKDGVAGLRDYKIEKPLWIFVGSRVREDASDLLKIVEFLHWLLTEDRKTIHRLIGNILSGKSGIVANQEDAFAPRYPERNFTYLREALRHDRMSVESICDCIFNEIFHISPEAMGRKLHLIDLKNAEGEIALRAGNSDKYFGVINIGEKSEFLKLVKEKAKGITIETAAIGESLFDQIREPTSTINVLIGAKKFIEGWDCWRVSNMCLLNVGKSEGPQIIQLFGRGVRLKGKGYSLKRSEFVPPPHPPHIDILETLQVYGVKANYLDMFKQIIEKENIPMREVPLKAERISPFPSDLQVLGLREGWSFDEELVALEVQEDMGMRIDLLPHAKIIDGREEQSLIATGGFNEKIIGKQILDLLDWNEIYWMILDYKHERKLFNISISQESLRKVLYEGKYSLFCGDELAEPYNYESLEQTKDVVVRILKKYLDTYYSRKRNAAEKDHLELRPLNETDDNITKVYRILIKKDDKILAENIEKLEKTRKIYECGVEVKLIGDMRTYIDKNPTSFRNAYFRNHLYQPLLVRQNIESIVTIPSGLNEGEAKFVEDLNTYLSHISARIGEVYLLRNQTKGKGIGFYESHSFYPDFIMWIKQNSKQTILFIDPKGLTHLSLEDPKLKLHEYLKNEIQKKINNPDVILDAFIISVTPFSTLSKMNPGRGINLENLEKDNHILFQYKDNGVENISYVERLFEIATNSEAP